jgi:L-aspartate oxidase
VLQPQSSTGFDVLVIGGGAAGLYAALCLPSHYRVGLITKETLTQSASDWAQGGIAAAIASDDSVQLHLEDTLSAGAGLCDVDAVQYLVSQAPDCIESLLTLGVAFDQSGDRPALTLEAAHRRPRVLHAADATGRAVVTTLTRHVYQRPNITVLANTFVFDLLLDPATGACQGAIAAQGGQIMPIPAAVVVLATGGGGQVFSQTTNPLGSTGDGVAIAWRAGAVLRDLEFMQFHPTALMTPGAPHFLISEAVRGEGAYLRDEQGHRFMFDYHPAGELAARDIVSRSIYQHLQHQAKTVDGPAVPHVWLDLRAMDPAVVRRRFPTIIQRCHSYGIDVFQQPIPVAPAAHYWMGGVLTDLQSATSIPHLYAVGETASTGVHGANRLASNSLLECVVFGYNMTGLTLPAWEAQPSPGRSLPWPTPLQDPDLLGDLAQQRRSLQQRVWNHAGICRDQQSLEAAIAQIDLQRQQFIQHPLSDWLLHTALPAAHHAQVSTADQPELLQAWGELRNLLDIAHLMLKSAAFRTESRGGHYRQDYPSPSDRWQVHTLIHHDTLSTSAPRLALGQPPRP